VLRMPMRPRLRSKLLGQVEQLTKTMRTRERVKIDESENGGASDDSTEEPQQ
jgi:hypothetical protein